MEIGSRVSKEKLKQPLCKGNCNVVRDTERKPKYREVIKAKKRPLKRALKSKAPRLIPKSQA